MSNIKVTFLDGGRSPRCQPNPAYPEGIDVDLSDGAAMTCMTTLPYPAPRCGLMLVVCKRCGFSAIVTVAGRQDDPRSAKLPCKGS
jgi:hypothetical protein